MFCRRAPVDPEWRPFCSQRCQLQDLAKWADGAYAIPAESPHDEPDDGADDEADDDSPRTK